MIHGDHLHLKKNARRFICAGLALLWACAASAEEPAPPASQAASAAVAASAADGGGAALKSVEEMLVSPRADSPGGPWKIARLRGNPLILVIEFPDLHSQGAAFNRIAALTEKAGGPRDRVLSDQNLSALVHGLHASQATFLFGHDYRSSDLARFFNLMSRQQIEPTPTEARMLQLLLEQRVVAHGEKTISAASPEQAVITFPQMNADDPATPVDETVDAWRRETILRHELSHGQFFTRKDYRDYCWWFWQTELGLMERQRFRDYLQGLDYDSRNEELMANEAQALMMHTPDERAFQPADVGMSRSRLQQLRTRFAAGAPPNVLPVLFKTHIEGLSPSMTR